MAEDRAAAEREQDMARPGSVAELVEILRAAAADGVAVGVCGRGSRRGLGAPPAPVERWVTTTGLSGFTRLDVEDLTCGLRAGTPFDEVQATLTAEGLALASGPFAEPALRTIGGLFAEAPPSPRGADRGSLRSQLLGVRVVDGRGRDFRAGSRVVKSVTGYDLMKLCVGSGGAYGVVAELELRLVRRPEAVRIRRSARLPRDEAMSLWRRLREDRLEALALDLVLDGGTGRVELVEGGAGRSLEAAMPAPCLVEEEQGAELWDRCAAEPRREGIWLRGRIRPSLAGTLLVLLGPTVEGIVHRQGDFCLRLDPSWSRPDSSWTEADEDHERKARAYEGIVIVPESGPETKLRSLLGGLQAPLHARCILGPPAEQAAWVAGEERAGLAVAARIKQRLAPHLNPGILAFDTAAPRPEGRG